MGAKVSSLDYVGLGIWLCGGLRGYFDEGGADVEGFGFFAGERRDRRR